MYVQLTGAPGSGKSTVIQRLASRLSKVRLAGFCTAEIRERGERRGFRLVTYDGNEALIAHVDLPKTHRVGKYGVDLAAIDRAVDATLEPRGRIELYLVDEIGKMECLSEPFVASMRRILNERLPVIATVASRGTGFIAEVKRRKDGELRTLTRANRDAMPEQLLAWLRPLL